MTLKRLGALAILMGALGGCSTPYAVETKSPPEQLGGHFQAEALTHNGTSNAVVVAVHAQNDKGLLKVCGLYIYGGGGDDFSRFQQGITDQNSFVELGTEKDLKGVRLHAGFLHPHVSSPGALLDGVLKNPGPPPSLEKIVMDADAAHLSADCVTTQTPWRPGFAQVPFVPNLVITTRTTIWVRTFHHR